MRTALTVVGIALAFGAGWLASSARRAEGGRDAAREARSSAPSGRGDDRPRDEFSGADARTEESVPESVPEPVPLVAPRDGCNLTGDVSDDGDRVLAGLELELRPCPAARAEAGWSGALSALSGAAVTAATTSDAKGGFVFEGVPAGGWALFVRGGTDLPRAAYCFRLTKEQRAVHKALVLPRGRSLSGIVFDPEGGACSEAWLRVSGLDAPFESSTRSASDGRFVLGPLLAGRYRLEASADESLTIASLVVGAGEEGLELRLAPAGCLRVRIRDESGAPVVARLALHGPSERSEVGADLRLARLTPGSYELVARADDGRTVMEELTLAAGLAPVPLELVLRSAPLEPSSTR